MPLPEENAISAKKVLDAVIKKSRVHFYKPIQIAEILHRHRTLGDIDLNDLESYRNVSKKWRDEITTRLVGRRCTSSQKYQDDLFGEKKLSPPLIAALGLMNGFGKGCVEAYIYKALLERLSDVHDVERYVKQATAESFDLKKFESFFIRNSGLKRSVDKMYEISVYALFSTLVRALKAQITVEVLNEDKEVLHDFEKFIRSVLGITAATPKLTLPASLYRIGVTNAADRGMDMLANFGAAIQVKHLTLTPETLEDIADNIMADRIVVVCRDAEKDMIQSLLGQVGWQERIQGIITLQDLDGWYGTCLGKKYRSTLGATLLEDLTREFNSEFPSGEELLPFIKERGYSKVELPAGWNA